MSDEQWSAGLLQRLHHSTRSSLMSGLKGIAENQPRTDMQLEKGGGLH